MRASLQLAPTLCDPVDCSPPRSSVHKGLQARILEWVATPSSRGSPQPRDRTSISCVSCIGRGLFTTSATWEAPSLYYLPQKSPWSPREIVFCADFQDFAQTFSIRTCMGGAKESAFLILICIHPPHKNQSFGILIFQNHCLAG